MPRKPKSPLSQPLFSEPVFQEEVPTPDPSQFTVTPNDQQFYTTQVQSLLKTEVVGFDKASGKPNDLYTLAEAWGPHGSDVINSINVAKCITFHMIGDSGATAQWWVGTGLEVSLLCLSPLAEPVEQISRNGLPRLHSLDSRHTVGWSDETAYGS